MWILIVIATAGVVNHGIGISVYSIEFTTRSRCEAAARGLEKAPASRVEIVAACVEK